QMVFANAAYLQIGAGGEIEGSIAVMPPRLRDPAQSLGGQNAAADFEPHEQPVLGHHWPPRARAPALAHRGFAGHGSASRTLARQARGKFRRVCQKPRSSAFSNPWAIAFAALGFAWIRKSRTAGAPRVA